VVFKPWLFGRKVEGVKRISMVEKLAFKKRIFD